MKIKIKISKKELAKIVTNKTFKTELQLNSDKFTKDVLKAIHDKDVKSQE